MIQEIKLPDLKQLTTRERSQIYLELAEYFENDSMAKYGYVCNELLKKIDLLNEIYKNDKISVIDKLKIESIEKYFPEFFLFKNEWEYNHWFSATHFENPKDGRALSLFLCYEMTKENE